jgi:hypothetical protein
MFVKSKEANEAPHRTAQGSYAIGIFSSDSRAKRKFL